MLPRTVINVHQNTYGCRWESPVWQDLSAEKASVEIIYRYAQKNRSHTSAVLEQHLREETAKHVEDALEMSPHKPGIGSALGSCKLQLKNGAC